MQSINPNKSVFQTNKTDNLHQPKLRFKEFVGEWTARKLGDIANFSKGRGISKSDIEETGKYECIRYGELYTTYGELINNVASRTNVDPKLHVRSEINDVIIPASGETQIDIATAACIMKNDVILGGDLNIIKANMNGIFLSYYLNSLKKNEIARLSQGVSVVHLYSSQLKTLKLHLPTLPEQQKIASFLTAVDQKIELLNRKKEKLQQYKKGVMQQIFSQQIRFKQDDGTDFPDWEEKKLSYYLKVSKVKNFDLKYGKTDVLSVSGEYGIVNQMKFQGRSFAGVSVHNYGVVEKGDIVYTKSPLKANPYGIIKVNKGRAGIVSTLYAVYKCKPTLIGEYIDYYFQLDANTNRYLRPLVQKGAKNDMKINNDKVLIDPIMIPQIEEQRKIIIYIESLDQKIQSVNQQLEKAQQFKKGLLQQMLV